MNIKTYIMKKFICYIILLMTCASCSTCEQNVEENALHVSENGIAFIKRYERFSATKYRDNYGYSIGYGHLIKRNETFAERIDEQYASELLTRDIERDVLPAVKRVVSKLRFRASQNLIDGLASIIYNCGERGFKQSSFYTRLLNCRADANGDCRVDDWNFTMCALKNCRIPAKSTGCQKSVLQRRKMEKMLICGTLSNN